jgi:hypothetical protein
VAKKVNMGEYGFVLVTAGGLTKQLLYHRSGGGADGKKQFSGNDEEREELHRGNGSEIHVGQER